MTDNAQPAVDRFIEQIVEAWKTSMAPTTGRSRQAYVEMQKRSVLARRRNRERQNLTQPNPQGDSA